MKNINLTLIFCVFIFFINCKDSVEKENTNVSEGPHPWTHLNWNNNPDNFQFAIVGDRTGNHIPGVFKSAVGKLNLLQPEFVLSVGDLIEGKQKTGADELNAMWDEFNGMINKLDMPFFYTVGNHDITNEEMSKQWYARYGRSYYHFLYRDVLFLCLCTEEQHYPRTGGISISDEQADYFRDVLEKNKDVRWTFVRMHKPVWEPVYTKEPVKNWEKIESMLSGRKYTVFAGHNHKFNKTIRNGMRYYVLSATGARVGDVECRFQHIVWVTMKEKEPVVAVLLLDGILSDEPCAE